MWKQKEEEGLPNFLAAHAAEKGDCAALSTVTEAAVCEMDFYRTLEEIRSPAVERRMTAAGAL